MSSRYIRETYGVPCYLRRPIEVDGKRGQIVRCTGHVYISIEGRKARPYHPTDPALRFLSGAELRAWREQAELELGCLVIGAMRRGGL